jgi:CRISPR-associated endonuclease Cas1
MHPDHTIRSQTVPIRNGVVILNGYGVKVAVDRRHLAVSDGIGRRRREACFAKAPSRLKRLLVIAQTGFVTLEALRWLSDAGAAFIQLDYEGTIQATTINGLDDARLRRAQALIPSTEHAVPMAKLLLAPKIRGQLSVLDSFGLAGSSEVSALLKAVDGADRLEALLRGEARAAEVYWESWAPVSMQFARRDAMPDHWRSFGSRRSPLTLGSRNAANPLNALLNYLYALLEVETRLALVSRGLDPGLGLFHEDKANRQSFAADVMEPVRPHVGAYVLNLARTRTFSARDFVEARDGACRLSSALTHELAATMPTWATLLAPHVDAIAKYVGRIARSGAFAVYPIEAGSKKNVRPKPEEPVVIQRAPKKLSTVPMSALSNACRECGAPLSVRKRIYCDACGPAIIAANRNESKAAFAAAGSAKLAAMRATGFDPTNTGEARQRKIASSTAARRAVVAWKDDGSLRDVDFKQDILPGLQSVLVRVIAEAMSSSLSHGSKVRGGRLVPHRRHWPRLLELLESLRKQESNEHEHPRRGSIRTK